MKLNILTFVAALFLSSTAYAGSPALFISPDDPSLAWEACPGTEAEQCSVAVLQGDMVGLNSDVLLRISAGFEFPWHKHTSAEHIIVLAGNLSVEYEGQEEDTAEAGSFLYGPAERYHRGNCGPDESCLLFISFDEPFDNIPMEE